MPAPRRGTEHHYLAGGNLRLPVSLLTGRSVVSDNPFAAGETWDIQDRTGDRQRRPSLCRNIARQDPTSGHVADLADEALRHCTDGARGRLLWRRLGKVRLRGDRDAAYVVRGIGRVRYERQRIV